MSRRVAIVTGGNRGLGFETCRQLARREMRVLLTARAEASAEKAAGRLREEGLEVEPATLDVRSRALIREVCERARRSHGRIDVLVNNAGVLLDPGWPVVEANLKAASALTIDPDVVRESMETNLLGALRCCQEVVPIMLRGGYGRIVNVSTGMGQLSRMGGGWAGYRTSKAALNALTRILAAELQGSGILVNSVNPGWVKTDMGGPDAPRSTAEGVDTIVWLATLPADGPTGSFFKDREAVDW